MSSERGRAYPVLGGLSNDHSKPNYERVVRSLTAADLADEIKAGRGEAGYQKALLLERDRRERSER